MKDLDGVDGGVVVSRTANNKHVSALTETEQMRLLNRQLSVRSELRVEDVEHPELVDAGHCQIVP